METGMYFWIVILKQGIQFHDIVTWNFSASQIPFSKLKIIFIQHRHSQSKILLLYLMLYAYIIHDCWNAAHDILIASAETLCELINSPWVSFSTVLFKAAIHLTGQNHWILACLEPLDHGAVPLVAVPSLLELDEGREPLPLPPPWALCSSLAHTHKLWPHVSAVSALGLEQTQNSCSVDRDHDKAGSHRAVCGRNQVITIKKSNYWVIKCARCQKLHEAEYK